ncbi:MAG: A/G-specific adenine glycosylase [Planctomycetes bacterium]|nr:A/G-specific adenine glycosylase [Planctomycetota bacterium]
MTARPGSNTRLSEPEGLADARECPTWTPRRLGLLRKRSLDWFRGAARDLPWRRTRDPYAIWISEIMLQQTQVATVVPYYERFVARFPTVQSLADAEEHDVLRYWEGLGYYRRARQLHAAARRIRDEHRGRFPEDFDAVLGLPGIGRYTAGAICSIAFDQRTPILEANTVRLFSRLLPLLDDPRGALGRDALWDFAARILPRSRVGAFNQSLMELGSEVCRPKDPRCAACPLRALCPTAERGWQDRIPVPPPRTRIERVTEAAVIVAHHSDPHRVLVVRRGSGERWEGLWDFPRFPIPRPDGPWLDELVDRLRTATGVTVRGLESKRTLTHGVTRYRITLHCCAARAVAVRRRADPDARWVRVDDLERLAMSSTGRTISRWLRDGEPAAGGTSRKK